MPNKLLRTTCKGCFRFLSIRKRGLCGRCVREVYGEKPVQTRHRPKGRPDFNGIPPLAEPTEALPGTEAKIRAMAERVARDLAVFHPDDGRLQG